MGSAYNRIMELCIMKQLNMIDYKTFLEQELMYYKDQVDNANEEITRIQKELDEL